jgi:hypothetical protein
MAMLFILQYPVLVITHFNYEKRKTMSKSNKAVNPFVQAGITLAEVFFKADSSANTSKRDAILNASVLASDKDKAKAILDSYVTQLKSHGYSDAIVRVRKSEANTVFKAFNATTISEANQTALKAFEGDYNGFIALARKLLPKTETATAKPAKAKKLELTDKQESKSYELLERASAKQLADIVDTASVQINKLVAPKMAGRHSLILINSIASNALKIDALEEYERGVFQTLFNESDVAIKRLEQASKDAQQATASVMNNTPLPASEVTPYDVEVVTEVTAKQ